MILDSNAISDWWQGRAALLIAVYLPVPVLAEFRFGILKSTRRAQMEVSFERGQTANIDPERRCGHRRLLRDSG